MPNKDEIVRLVLRTLHDLANTTLPVWDQIYLRVHSSGPGHTSRERIYRYGRQVAVAKPEPDEIKDRLDDLLPALFDAVAAEGHARPLVFVFTVDKAGEYKLTLSYDDPRAHQISLIALGRPTSYFKPDEVDIPDFIFEFQRKLAEKGITKTPILGWPGVEARPSKEDVYEQIKGHAFFRLIRGEQCVFGTPPGEEAPLLPTDHHELLVHAVYPLVEQHSATFMQQSLDLALRAAASDALGVFCAIRCYFMQIRNEDNGAANLELDRAGLPQYLASRYFAVLEELKSLVMEEQPDRAEYAQRVALSYLRILQARHGVQLAID
ncbi:hypothetical protein [Pseudoduganella violaceinigra]|uniref:hypothetical protein n=1 Tax=Pseudoduganella violaceinigra TaxID=246602 RepID=UPI0004872CEF|nr:hypothetical protein [Pseudoduganella violaceinigra]